MTGKRDTYKYHFKNGRKIIKSGITDDLERREGEHQRKPGWSGGHILQVGRPALPRRLLGSGKRSKRKRSCIKIERVKAPAENLL